MSKKTKIVVLADKYKELNQHHKDRVKQTLQSFFNWSEATFYNKLKDQDALNMAELKAIAGEICTAYREMIEEGTNSIDDLNKNFFIRNGKAAA